MNKLDPDAIAAHVLTFPARVRIRSLKVCQKWTGENKNEDGKVYDRRDRAVYVNGTSASAIWHAFDGNAVTAEDRYKKSLHKLSLGFP